MKQEAENTKPTVPLVPRYRRHAHPARRRRGETSGDWPTAPDARRCGSAGKRANAAASGIVLLLLLAPVTIAEENVRLACVPRTFQVVPGEPVKLELTVQADSAAPLRLYVRKDPLLILRAIEKLPVQRTREGAVVHKRIVLWQALEPGTVKMKSISVETKGRKLLFPEITIAIRDPSP